MVNQRNQFVECKSLFIANIAYDVPKGLFQTQTGSATVDGYIFANQLPFIEFPAVSSGF